MLATSRRRRFLMRSFGFWQRLGLHVTPVDYYQPIPDTRELDLSEPGGEAVLEGLELDLPGQLEMLRRLRDDFQAEYQQIPRNSASGAFNGFFVENGAFGPVDAEILYCMVRDRKPSRMVEIGRGFSTLLSASALQANAANGSEQATFVSIDPTATDAAPAPPVTWHALKNELNACRLTPSTRWTAMTSCSSTPVTSCGSGGDVVFAILEVLPRLRPGVAVHFHDIFLPNDYPPEWLTRLRRFWSEQYLLQAFLLFNGSFRVLWAGSCMHLRHRDELTRAFDSYDPRRHWPGSFWIERVR